MLRKVLQERLSFQAEVELEGHTFLQEAMDPFQTLLRNASATAHGSENVFTPIAGPLRSCPTTNFSCRTFAPRLQRATFLYFFALSIVLAKFTLGQQAHKIVLNKKRRKQINNSIFLARRVGRGRSRSRKDAHTCTINVKPWRMKLQHTRSILCSAMACHGTLTHTRTPRYCDFRFSGRVNYLHELSHTVLPAILKYLNLNLKSFYSSRKGT